MRRERSKETSETQDLSAVAGLIAFIDVDRLLLWVQFQHKPSFECDCLDPGRVADASCGLSRLQVLTANRNFRLPKSPFTSSADFERTP